LCAQHDAKVCAEILNNLVEEETGKMSGSAPHPELHIRLGEAELQLVRFERLSAT